MITLEDHIGTVLSFKNTPQRIVSLVPSQTELLVHLGLRQSLVGVTKFCVHPESLRSETTVVGGTKQVNYDKINALDPDLILCNKEENTKELVEQLRTITSVHVSDVKTIEDSLRLITDYGCLLSQDKKATKLITQISSLREAFRTRKKKGKESKRVAYLIWQQPYMVAGSDTFINSLLSEIGLSNAFTKKSGRYPEITVKDLKDVDEIFLSSEPFPFKNSHLLELQKHTRARITLVNGEYFSWYGSRLLQAFPYFSKLCKELKL